MPRSSSSSTSSRRRVKERNIPKTGALDALVYFSGRDPRRVKAVRAVYHEVDDSVSIRSGSSMWSMWSASSQNNAQYYFVEPRGYWAEPQEYGLPQKTKARASGPSRGPQQNPTAAWARNATVHDVSDDSDSDDGSDTSLDQYGPQGGPGPGPAPGHGPFMRPPGIPMPPRGPPNGHPQMGGPPAGYPPQFNMGPRPPPHPQMGQAGPGMPPPHAFPRPPPPPGLGGQFVPNPTGVRGFQG